MGIQTHLFTEKFGDNQYIVIDIEQSGDGVGMPTIAACNACNIDFNVEAVLSAGLTYVGIQHVLQP